MSNPVSLALSEVVTAMRAQGGFNDRATATAWKNVGDTLEQRAWEIDPTTRPKVEAAPVVESHPVAAHAVHTSHPLVPHSSPVLPAEMSH